MRICRLFLCATCIGFAAQAWNARADDAPQPISAADLAGFLHVHWWFLRLPGTAQPGSSIAVQWIGADGTGITGSSATMTNTSLAPGALVKIYLQDVVGGPVLKIETPGGGLETTFPAISLQGAALGGLANGTFANSGDILLKLVHRKADGSLEVATGNQIDPGDEGMRVVVRPPAK